MGFWDKIKSWLGINKVKAIPEGQTNQRDSKNEDIIIQRRDGSSITLRPRFDKVGEQALKPVFNAKTGEMQYTYEYTIEDKALANAKTIHGASFATILMDIDANLLKDPTYNYYIADILLEPERITEIIDSNEHYAGGLNIGDKGQILGYHCDDGVIQGLNASRNELFNANHERSEAAIAEMNKQQQEYQDRKGVNIKTSHAEQLDR